MTADWIKKEGYSTKLLASDEDLSAEGVEAHLTRFETGKYSHHHKKKTEFFYVVSGQGSVILDGEQLRLVPGVSFVVRPGVKHTFINESPEPLQAIMVKTNNDLKDTYTD